MDPAAEPARTRSAACRKAWAAGYAGSNGGIPYTDVLTYLSSLTMNYKLADHLILYLGHRLLRV